MQAASTEIVAVERNIEQAKRGAQAEQGVEAMRNPGAAAVDTDDLRVSLQVRANLLGEFGAVRLGVG